MKFHCPDCGAPFDSMGRSFNTVTCPSCGTTFQPVDEKKLQSEQRAEIAERILGYFEEIRTPLASRIAQALAADPPLPGKQGYLGREAEIEALLEQALGAMDADLTDAMLMALSEAQDWCFCHKLLERTTVSQAAEEAVATTAMRARYLGGQSGDYFHLLTILAKKRTDVRTWCDRIRRKERPDSILAENMQLVLAGRA